MRIGLEKNERWENKDTINSWGWGHTKQYNTSKVIMRKRDRDR